MLRRNPHAQERGTRSLFSPPTKNSRRCTVSWPQPRLPTKPRSLLSGQRYSRSRSLCARLSCAPPAPAEKSLFWLTELRSRSGTGTASTTPLHTPLDIPVHGGRCSLRPAVTLSPLAEPPTKQKIARLCPRHALRRRLLAKGFLAPYWPRRCSKDCVTSETENLCYSSIWRHGCFSVRGGKEEKWWVVLTALFLGKESYVTYLHLEVRLKVQIMMWRECQSLVWSTRGAG